MQNIGVTTIELTTTMFAIEKAFVEIWQNLWLESDSQNVVIHALEGKMFVPWVLENRWINCI